MTTTEMLLKMFPNGGYFVEAGAHDGIGDSQTKALEDAGWDGLCVEPSSAFRGLKRSRKCKVDNHCLYSWNGRAMFREIEGNGIELSGVVDDFDDHWDRDNRPHVDRLIDCVTLTTLLSEHCAPSLIEFLCLDTEGSELAILTVHDFARYRFRVIEVEHNGIEQRQYSLSKLLGECGYAFHSTDGINNVYTFAGS